MKQDLYVTFDFDPHNVLFLVNKDEDAFQIYENGKYIDTEYLYSRDSHDIMEAVRRTIYFEYSKGYDTKILGYGHDFEDEEDFLPDVWTLAWAVGSWIKPTFWTTLTTAHSSGLWTKFILPKTIVDNNEIKITRWFNHYYTKKRGE